MVLPHVPDSPLQLPARMACMRPLGTLPTLCPHWRGQGPAERAREPQAIGRAVSPFHAGAAGGRPGRHCLCSGGPGVLSDGDGGVAYLLGSWCQAT